jgi:hypothetical protein
MARDSTGTIEASTDHRKSFATSGRYNPQIRQTVVQIWQNLARSERIGSIGEQFATIAEGLRDDISFVRANGEGAGEGATEVDHENPDAGFHG